MNNDYRIALFVDYEDLSSTLRKKAEREKSNKTPIINLEYLFVYVRKFFGSLQPEDFIILADLSRRQQELDGLDHLARMVSISQYLPLDGEKPAAKNLPVPHLSQSALAFEAGKHVVTRPADYYLILSSNPASASVASALRDQHKRQVQFILPDADKPNILQSLFPVLDFANLQPKRKTAERFAEQTAPAAPIEPGRSDEIAEILGELRRELRTGIPLNLVKVILGIQNSQKALDRARSENRIDIWENESGISCVSSQDERVVGNIIKMEVRPAVLKAADVLYRVGNKMEETRFPLSRSEWRKYLRQESSLSNAEAKAWLEKLFEQNILQDGQSGNLKLDTAKILKFITSIEEEKN